MQRGRARLSESIRPDTRKNSRPVVDFTGGGGGEPRIDPASRRTVKHPLSIPWNGSLGEDLLLMGSRAIPCMGSLSLSLIREFRLSNSDAAAPVHDPATTRAHVYLAGVNREKYVLARARACANLAKGSFSSHPSLSPSSLALPAPSLNAAITGRRQGIFLSRGLIPRAAICYFPGYARERRRSIVFYCITNERF